jgi:hypothetical protein
MLATDVGDLLTARPAKRVLPLEWCAEFDSCGFYLRNARPGSVREAGLSAGAIQDLIRLASVGTLNPRNQESVVRNHRSSVAALTSLIVLFSAPAALASGDKNTYNNPKDPIYEEPFANYDDEGRMMIFCAEDALLVVVPAQGGALEVTCQVVE